MKTKSLVAATMVFAGVLSQESFANSHHHSTMPQFYAGASMGVQRLTGRRNEYSVWRPAGFPVANTPFSTQKSFSNCNGFYSMHGGFTWTIPSTPIFIGPEIYLGRGSASNDFRQSVEDAALGLSRSLTASIRQHTFLGGVFQFGVHVPCQISPYLLLGFESSQFEYTGSYVPLSQQGIFNARATGPADDYPMTLLNARKWQRGFLWGVGVDKKVGSVTLGADIRVLRYRETKISKAAISFDPETLFSSFKIKNIRFGLKVSYLF